MKVPPTDVEYLKALRTVRALIDLGHPLDVALLLSIVPDAMRQRLRDDIEGEQNVTLVPAKTISSNPRKADWVVSLDRSSWYFWPTLRTFLLTHKEWNLASVRSLDDSSDRILRQLASPSDTKFDVRGLVLGFVQSGKTANFTALIAKAVDAGYRLIIVLSGIDNGLRRQTNARLKKELVGYPTPRDDSVPFPPRGQQWFEFTREEMNGDFQSGYANQAALQGTQPVLLVVKKNGAVLRRLTNWLNQAPLASRTNLPILVVDDEADQASIDTRGMTGARLQDPEDVYEPPSVINGLIRGILQLFDRRSYVAYTATPFANILIPHDADDPEVGNDLYPKDFIVDLPKLPGYFGAEEFFGRFDRATGESVGGLDVIRFVDDEDIAILEDGDLPPSAQNAIVDFVLAGAARAERGMFDSPAAMLIHTSSRVLEHNRIKSLVATKFAELKDEWRYQKLNGIRSSLKARWESDQSPTTRRINISRERTFEQIEPYVGSFFESVEVREVNSQTGEVIDYDREPSLKAILVGGNRLSRGLTIEGLLVSYFVRRSPTYDTLMQMGRWFGYRAGYEDLTRIYTTAELGQWFSDLAVVEFQLRQDIALYENMGLTPAQVGVRIWKHPAMEVTSLLKQRSASTTMIRQSFDLSLVQTFKFPFRKPELLAELADSNLDAVRRFIEFLGPSSADESGTVWKDVPAKRVTDFLRSYRQDDAVRGVSLPLVLRYIEECVVDGELISWTVAVRGRQSLDVKLGGADWGRHAGVINQISRTRLKSTDSLGVITGQGDEATGLTPALGVEAQRLVEVARDEGRTLALNNAAREIRAPSNGLLLLYPISRYSGYGAEKSNRQELFANPQDQLSRDLIGIALSFPRSGKDRQVEAYVVGTVSTDFRPVDANNL